MNRQVKRKRNKVFIFALLFLIMACLLFPAFCKISSVSADSVDYTDVLTDLQKDETFDVGQYPIIHDDYSLQVIQIAEGVDNELFVYTYQPNAFEEMHATSINISTTIDDDLNYHNYKLQYINSNSVFFKYRVEDFVVSEQVIRYYDISSIYRPYYDLVDDEVVDDDNIREEKPFAVAKLFTAITSKGIVQYFCTDVDVIEVTDKYVSNILQAKKVNVGDVVYENCHFVAFSTDINMDRLLQADVYYVSREYYDSFYGADTYGDPKNEQVTVNYTEVLENPIPNVAGFKIGRQYKWNKIETAEHFLSSYDDLTDEAKTAVGSKQWVLWFTETDMNMELAGTRSTLISEVTILRLKFETDGVVYNLGVVDNKQSFDGTSSSNEGLGFLKRMFAIISGIVIGFVVIILLLVFCPQVLVLIFKGIAYVIVWICKGLWWLITLPFKMFKKEK